MGVFRSPRKFNDGSTVKMTNRKEQGPCEMDNGQVYSFFEWWLKDRLDPAPPIKKPFSEKR